MMFWWVAEAMELYPDYLLFRVEKDQRPDAFEADDALIREYVEARQAFLAARSKLHSLEGFCHG